MAFSRLVPALLNSRPVTRRRRGSAKSTPVPGHHRRARNPIASWPAVKPPKSPSASKRAIRAAVKNSGQALLADAWRPDDIVSLAWTSGDAISLGPSARIAELAALPDSSPEPKGLLSPLPYYVFNDDGEFEFIIAYNDPRESHLAMLEKESIGDIAKRWPIPTGREAYLCRVALEAASREMYEHDANYAVIALDPEHPKATARAIGGTAKHGNYRQIMADHTARRPCDMVFPFLIALSELTKKPRSPLPADDAAATVNDRLAAIPENLRPFVTAHNQPTKLTSMELEQRAKIAQRISRELGKKFKVTFDPGAFLSETDLKSADHLFCVSYLPDDLHEIIGDDRKGRLVPQISTQLAMQGKALIDAAARLATKCRA
jgi:hypothetical protein